MLPLLIAGGGIALLYLQKQKKDAALKQQTDQVGDVAPLAESRAAIAAVRTAPAPGQVFQVDNNPFFLSPPPPPLPTPLDIALMSDQRVDPAMNAIERAADLANTGGKAVTESDDWSQVSILLRTSLGPPRYGNYFRAHGPVTPGNTPGTAGGPSLAQSDLVALYAAGYRFDAWGDVIRQDGSFA